MTRAQREAAGPSLHDSLREYGRGIAGGLLFSLPLLYTMEIWAGGLTIPSSRQLLLVLATFFLLLGYNRFAGLHVDTSWAEVAIDSVEELGLGVLISAGALLLLGQVSTGQSLRENLGIVVLEAMVVAIGVSVGTAQLGGAPADEEDPGRTHSRGAAGPQQDEPASFAGEMVIALCGAVLFAANVAPTEEIQIIAAETSSLRLLLLALISISLGGAILFYSHFIGTTRRRHRVGWTDAVRGSVATYAVALAASGLMLWYFGRFTGEGMLSICGQLVVLGLPAAIGASAGKLLLQTGSSR